MELELICALLREGRRFDSASELIKSERASGNHMVGFVAVGDGRSLYFTRRGEALVWKISRLMKLEVPALSRSHTDEEWRWTVRRALGPAIALTESTEDLEADAHLVLARLKSELSKVYPKKNSAISFGVTLFENSIVSKFDVGPVRIEPRRDWLKHAFVAGYVSRVAERRIAAHWSGLKLRKRRPSADSMSEGDVIDSMSDCHHVCTVATDGLAGDFARKKAITAAHLALVAFSLAWELPSSAFRGIRLGVDAGPYHQSFLRLHDGQACFADRTRVGLPHAPYVDKLEWETIFQAQQKLRSAAGEVIQAYLSTDGDQNNPTVVTTLFHALLWFYEGCHEGNDQLAIVKFGAGMDAISGEKKERGILSFIEARLGLSREESIFSDGQSIKNLVGEIYTRRSRSIHGNSVASRDDVSLVRTKSEKLARLCIIEALSWLSDHNKNAHALLMQLP